MGIKEKIKPYQRRWRLNKIKREREAKEGDMNRMTASDEIESNYGHRNGTEFYKGIMTRLKKVAEVSSPSATNRTANIAIYFAIFMKFISIVISYGVVVYIYENTMKQNFEMNPYLVSAMGVIVAVGIEFISSSFMKNVMNTTESIISRSVTFTIGIILSFIVFQSHYVYTELKNNIAKKENNVKVMKIETPTIHRLRNQIHDTNDTIAGLQSALGSQMERYNQRLSDIDAGALAYKNKGEKYQALVDQANAKKHRYISIGGKNKRVLRVQGWANTNMRLYREELAKKEEVEQPSNPRIEAYKAKKEKLQKELEDELKKQKINLDDKSKETGGINLWLQILISALAKVDLYGYWILRHNIKNRVLDRMHKIIDNANVVNQLNGIFEQFGMMTAQAVRAIGLTGVTVQNELASVNQTIMLQGNRQVKATHRLHRAMHDGVITDVEANYTATGDERIDIDEHQAQESQGYTAEILTQFVREQGHPHQVVFDPYVETASTVGNIIKINPELSDENKEKALIHELGHIKGKTHKHDANFRKGVDEAYQAKEKLVVPIKKHFDLSKERAEEIYSNAILGISMIYTNEEINYLKNRKAYSDNKLVFKDSLHLMDILDI